MTIKLLLILATIFATNVFAQTNIEIRECSKNPGLLFMKLTGNAAKIMSEHTIKGTPANSKLRMLCYQPEVFDPTPAEAIRLGVPSSVSLGDLQCTFVTDGKQMLVYPQLDPHFSGEKVIVCD